MNVPLALCVKHWWLVALVQLVLQGHLIVFHTSTQLKQ